MNLFYKYSHLQRFEQQNEKDGRKEKGQMRKEKDYKMTKEKGRRRRKIKVCKRKKGRWEKEKEKKKKRLPAWNDHSGKSLSYCC